MRARTHRSRGTPRPATTLVVAALLLAIAGCEEGGPAPPGAGAGNDTGTRDTVAGPPPVDRSAGLAELNGSGVRGEVSAMHSEAAIVLVIEATGLPGPREYAALLHAGRCSETPGAPPLTLNPVIGLPDSTGTSTTLLEPSEVSDQSAVAVRLVGPGDAPLACGELLPGTGVRSAVPAAP